jgi:hypothetical protein
MFSYYSLYEKIASILLHGVKTLSRRFLLSKYRTVGRPTLKCNLNYAHKKVQLISFLCRFSRKLQTFNNIAQMCCTELHRSQKISAEIRGMNFYLFRNLKYVFSTRRFSTKRFRFVDIFCVKWDRNWTRNYRKQRKNYLCPGVKA